MCIVTDVKPELKTAEEDIVVYKKVCVSKKTKFFGLIKTQEISSDVRGFKYKLNKLYHTTLDPFKCNYITDGYYSKRGFYSWKENHWANVKCIIPKGAKYYLCRDGLEIYISDQIKLVELI